MAALIDWVRRALEPRYEIDEEMARGGMGAVFRARDPRLQRTVAIKVLLPHIATTDTAERFLTEARVLARLQHAYIVPVHEVGESAGLFYYVMDFIEGATLRQRLEGGPLPIAQAMKVGRDLLDALEAVHAQGFVHRDIKPSNVFISRDRTVLGDFGVVKSTPAPGADITRAHQILGTREYMAPEQLETGEATPPTDLYAASMVIYEALTGRVWRVGVAPRQADWSGVPRSLASVLARGLSVDPRNRWPDARSYRRALWHTRVRRYQSRTVLLTAGALLVGALAISLLPSARPELLQDQGFVIRIAEPAYRGPASSAWLADSVPEAYARLMASSQDFRVCLPTETCPPATAVLHSVITVNGSMLDLHFEYEGARRIVDVYRRDSLPLTSWLHEVDLATDAGLRVMWTANSPFKELLPLEALPKSDEGFDAWFLAEQQLNQAKWRAALGAFEIAFARDSTCLLCSWRITEIQRWLVEPADMRHLTRARQMIDRFPEHYQQLIAVRWLPLDERLDTLTSATQRWPAFYYAWFLLGEELFHRGPLVGRSRAEAIPAFQRTTQLQPNFGPGWEHLAWASIAAGKAQGARDALDQYEALVQQTILADDYAVTIHALLKLGFAWRFSHAAAADVAEEVLADPRIANFPDAGAGPRLLGTFDSRQGMVGLADIMLQDPRVSHDVRYRARIAIALASLAQGRVREARHQLREIELDQPEHRELPLFALKLDAALALLDSQAIDIDRAALIDDLSSYEHDAGSPPGVVGAGWLRSLLEIRAGVPISRHVHQLPASLATIVRAAADPDARYGVRTTARDSLPLAAETLRELPQLSVQHLPDAFYRTILKFFRAGWLEQLNQELAAADELLFHEAWDLTKQSRSLPEAGEIDWAFGTLARWKRANLLARTQRVGAACQDLHVVAARWSGGDPVFQERAASAKAMSIRLGCNPPQPGLTW